MNTFFMLKRLKRWKASERKFYMPDNHVWDWFPDLSNWNLKVCWLSYWLQFRHGDSSEFSEISEMSEAFDRTIPYAILPFPCSSHLDNLNVPETLKTPPSNPQANFGEKVKSQPPGQIFWSNALPLGNFRGSNPQRLGRFSIFLLLMNNLSLRFQRRCFLPAIQWKRSIFQKNPHVY